MPNLIDEFILMPYYGEFDEHSNRLLEVNIVSKLEEHKDVIAVLISLKDLIWNDEKTELMMLVKELVALNSKLGVDICFIDYNKKLYKILKSVTKNTPIKLFRNLNTAALFLDQYSLKDGSRILVYDEDRENCEHLLSKLKNHEHTADIVSDPSEFKEMANKNAYDIIVTQSSYNRDSAQKSEGVHKLNLSKELIKNLPVFMDTTVETLSSFVDLKAEKVSHEVDTFNKNLDTDIISAVMEFRGDLEGSFILIFPRELAVTTVESLVGEKVNQKDIETLKDAVAEFCNIVTGSIKTELSKKNIMVNFALPKAYQSMNMTSSQVGAGNGVWVDMKLDEQPFYMFISK